VGVGVASKDRIVAVGLLSEHDLAKLGSDFDRVYPVDETPCFGELLRAIDEARSRAAAPERYISLIAAAIVPRLS
jgi:hypothetical protein